MTATIVTLVIGAVLGWALTMATEVVQDRRRRREAVAMSLRVAREHLFRSLMAVAMFSERGVWNGPDIDLPLERTDLLRRAFPESEPAQALFRGLSAANTARFLARSEVATHTQLDTLMTSLGEQIEKGYKAATELMGGPPPGERFIAARAELSDPPD